MSGVKPAWTTPQQIVAQVQRRWDDGAILAARLSGVSLFPLELSLRQPGAAQLGEQFDAVRLWIRQLEADAGKGYALVWREINHRQLGRNRLPAAAVIGSEADALRMLGRQADAARFDRLAAATLSAFPVLRDWMLRRPLLLLERAAIWPRVLATLRWFVAHPRPQLYARQLDIAGVDGKFIENHRALLAELLDIVLPADAIDPAATGARHFERRYGLLSKPVQIRFRILDPDYYVNGLSDLMVPVSQFAALKTDVRHVFITENEINGLAWPHAASGMVIFGGGYAIDRLGEIGWLHGRDLVYWGDIDTHGFAILDRLRASLPQARSILMDAATLERHRPLWGREDDDKRHVGQLTRLNAAEQALFEAIRDNVVGERVRMEQERLEFGWVEQAVAAAQKSLVIPGGALL